MAAADVQWRKDISEFVQKAVALILVVIPLASILVPNALTWAKDLNSLARRVRQLEELNRVVAFWENWIRVVSSTSPLDRWVESDVEERIATTMHQARLELLDAGRNVLYIYNTEEIKRANEFKLTFDAFQSYRRGLPWYRRLFLFYKAPNPMAKVFKFRFYFSIFAPIVVGAIEIPALEHLRKVGYLTPFGLKPVSDHQFAHLHPWIHPTVVACVLILALVVLVWVAILPPHRRTRESEDRADYYVMDRQSRRRSRIKPAPGQRAPERP